MNRRTFLKVAGASAVCVAAESKPDHAEKGEVLALLHGDCPDEIRIRDIAIKHYHEGRIYESLPSDCIINGLRILRLANDEDLVRFATQHGRMNNYRLNKFVAVPI